MRKENKGAIPNSERLKPHRKDKTCVL